MTGLRVPVWVTSVLVLPLVVGMFGGGAIASADEVPAEASPMFLADPPTDPFYSADGIDLEDLSNGTVLKTRELGSIPGIVVPHDATQLLVRSTDSKDRAIAAVTTVIVPEAAWEGSGPRPLVSEQLPINSLGADCNPSVKFQNGQFLTEELPPVAQQVLHEGYAVSIPDHMGPRNAYSAGIVAGHVVLDTVAAALTLEDSGLTPESPVAATGYSGGAIATGWAASLAPSYAQELNLVGATVGGTPSDFSLLSETMDRGLPLGLFASAAIGLIREYPELETVVNKVLVGPIADIMRNQCQGFNIVLGAPAGALGLGLENFSTVIGGLYNDPLVKDVIERNRMGTHTPLAPVLAVHGEREQWIPYQGAVDLQEEMCSRGADWQLKTYPGDHLSTGGQSIPDVVSWITDRIEGVAEVANGCTL